MDLHETYVAAAKTALAEGVRSEQALLAWIRAHVRYRPDTEFFVYLGIATELFDEIARERGFDSAVHEAYEKAVAKIQKKSRRML